MSGTARLALVTGGARRIGAAIVRRLSREGFAIALHHHRSEADSHALCAELRASGARISPFRADLSREAEAGALLGRVGAAMGRVSVLVNNASVFERDEWHDADRRSWDRHLETNLRAPFVLTQAFARQAEGTDDPVAVNVLDQRVWSPTPHFVSYTVSKAGLWALTQSLALALAPRVRVCAIGPGPVLPAAGETEAAFRRRAGAVPLGRPPGLDECGEAVMAILRLPSLTGQMLALDGGQHLQWSPRHPAGD